MIQIPVALRKARRRDAEFIHSRLERRREHRPDRPQDDLASMSARLYRRWFQGALRNPHEIHLVAEQGKHRIAYCHLWQDEGNAEGKIHLLAEQLPSDSIREAVARAVEEVRLNWSVAAVTLHDAGASHALADACTGLGFKAAGDEAERSLSLPLAPPTAEEIRAYKSRAWTSREMAAKYEQRVTFPKGVARIRSLVEVRYALRHVHAPVLDAGAGTGRFAHALLGAGREVVALDISREMLARARAAAPARLPVVNADLLRLPFADARFQSIVSIMVIEHLPHYRAALAELVRVLRPGGTIVFQVGSGENVERGGAPQERQGIASFIVSLKANEIEALIAELGLELVEIAPYNVFHKNLALTRSLGFMAPLVEKSVGLLCALPLVPRMFASLEIACARCLPRWAATAALVIARKPASSSLTCV